MNGGYICYTKVPSPKSNSEKEKKKKIIKESNYSCVLCVIRVFVIFCLKT